MPIFDNIEIGKRIKAVQAKKGISSSAMASEIEAHPAFLNKIELGKKPLSERYLEALLEKYSVNPIWVLFGVGEMFRPFSIEKSGSFEPDIHLLTQLKKQVDDLKTNFDKLVLPPQELPTKS